MVEEQARPRPRRLPPASQRTLYLLSWEADGARTARDALYQLDADGDSATEKDRKTTIATINQQLFAKGEGKVVSKAPLERLSKCRGSRPGTGIRHRSSGRKHGQCRSPQTLIPLERRRGEGKPLPVHPPFALRLIPGATPSPSLPRKGPLRPFHYRGHHQQQRALHRRTGIVDYRKGFPQRARWEPNRPPRETTPTTPSTSSLTSTTANTATTTVGSPTKEARDGVQLELPEPAVIDRIEWGRRPDGTLPRPSSDEIPYRGWPRAWQVVPADQSRPTGFPFKTEKTKPTPRYDFSLHPPEEAERGRKKLASTQKNRRGASPPSRNQPRSTPALCGAAGSRPGSCIGGTRFPQSEVVAPEGLDVLNSKLKPLRLKPDAPERDRRVAFAKWLIDPQNPLSTARVMVNRIWHYHFGRGLVATPSDFGDMGFRPDASRVIGLVGRGIHGQRLVGQAYAPSDPSLLRPTGRLPSPARTVWRRMRGASSLWRLPPQAVGGRSHPRQRALVGRSTRTGKCTGPAFCSSCRTPTTPATGSPRTTSSPRICAA